jgi:hypothetical protein
VHAWRNVCAAQLAHPFQALWLFATGHCQSQPALAMAAGHWLFQPASLLGPFFLLSFIFFQPLKNY